jgi:hypothetical protein
MVEYNNAAGRILAIFERLAPKSGQTYRLAEFAHAFGVTADWPTILVSYCGVREEYNALVEDIEQIKHNSAKYHLYRKNLPDIDISIKSFTFGINGDSGTCQISQTGLVALQFIAADLSQDEKASDDDLKTLRQLVSDLQAEIEATDIFPKQMKEWLLDLVRVIRDSIDRYSIRGSKGMRRQFSVLLGELMQNYDFAEKTKTEKPSVWSKITSAIDIMNKIASLAEKCRPAITFGQKLLPYMKTLGLPAPDADSTEGI